MKRLVAELRGPSAAVTDYAFSLAGDAVLLSSKDTTARLFDVTGRERAKFEHPGEVTSAQFLPGDQRIVTTCKDGAARLWSRGGELQAVIHAHHASCRIAGFDVTGEHLATAGEDFCARIWPATVEGLLATAKKRCFRDFTDDERAQYAKLLR